MKNMISDILMVVAIALVLGGVVGIYGLFVLGVSAICLYGVGIALIIAVGTLFSISNDLEDEVEEDKEERL